MFLNSSFEETANGSFGQVNFKIERIKIGFHVKRLDFAGIGYKIVV